MALTKVNTTNAALENLEIAGTEAARMPVGTTAQRTNAQVGDLRHNSELGVLEQYTSDGWTSIAAFPTITSISPSAIPATDSSFDITIAGQNFSSGATVKAIGTDGSEINATSTVRNSSSELVATFDGTSFSDAQEDYDIKVTNSTGLATTLDNCLSVNATPAWVTSNGATIIEDWEETSVSYSLQATDPEGGSLTYTLASGSNALPSGLSLASNGTISGTLPTVTADTAVSISVDVSDGSNTANRSFTINNKDNVLKPTSADWLVAFEDNLNNTGADATYNVYASNLGYSTTKKYGSKAASFNGYNNYMSVEQATNFLDTFTMGFWWYFDNANQYNGRTYLFDWRVDGTSPYFLYDNSSAFAWWLNGSEWLFSYTMTPGNWYHFVLTSNSSTGEAEVYINGAREAYNNTTYCNHSGRKVIVGTYFGSPGGSGDYFAYGKMDNLFLWEGDVFTSTQIQGIYNGTNHTTSFNA